MRLIDADALKEGIKELKQSPWYNNDINPSWKQGIKDAVHVVETLCIDEEPTVDAVPVIRCKDCMWFSIDQLKSDGTPDMRCKPTWCSLHRTYAKAEFFCSWGNEG